MVDINIRNMKAVQSSISRNNAMVSNEHLVHHIPVGQGESAVLIFASSIVSEACTLHSQFFSLSISLHTYHFVTSPKCMKSIFYQSFYSRLCTILT